MDKGEIDHRVDLEEVILRNQAIETNHLRGGQLRLVIAKHPPMNQKSPPIGEDFVSSLRAPSGALTVFLTGDTDHGAGLR